MSAESEVVTQQHLDYIAARTQRDDEFLLDLKQQAAEAGIPRIWISPEQGSLMQILLRTKGAREVLEVVTLAGYSAIQMARALGPEGRVVSVEISDRFADFAEQWIARSDVAARVEIRRGDATQVLAEFSGESFDAAFVDADKGNYPTYLKECTRLLRPGGLLMVDNAFAFGQLFDEHPTDREVGAVRAFNEVMAGSADFQSVIVPVGDGCWVGVKL